jgi:hypothetical protein
MIMPAMAQFPPPGIQIPIGNSGNYVQPFMDVRFWSGYIADDKYASGVVGDNGKQKFTLV